ncbi:MAG: dTMP kinase [Patescibacteria group bacterium]
MIIAFEGPEGGGKGTQLRLLEKFLKESGYEVIVVREPGGTMAGEIIRNMLLNLENITLSPLTETLLFFAARSQLISEIIEPAVKRKKVVLMDRSFWSTLAYQGYARGIRLTVLKTLARLVVGRFTPDLVILLDLPVEAGLSRKHGQNEVNRLEAEDIEFHRKVRNGYLKLCKEEKGFWVKIDATNTIPQIQKAIQTAVTQKLEQHK